MNFRARLAYDHARGEYRDGALRYLLIRPEALMALIAELPDRAQALEAFARAIHRVGAGSARAYRDAGAGSADALLATIEATAPQLGWGRWAIARTADALAVTVTNSPFAAASPGQGAACAPIRGMLCAVGEMVLGAAAIAEETACAADGAPCCRFAVRRATPPG
ncbi:MAG: 4-vinyl reductase [Rhodospirillales bacterium]|nr:4-vinyl reductase [Rhodospirillales bacterium]